MRRTETLSRPIRHQQRRSGKWRGPAMSFGRFGFELDDTYLIEWKLQPDGLTYASGVGGLNPLLPVGPFPRWRHNASLDWDNGPWGATLAETYQSSYQDLNQFQPPFLSPPNRGVELRRLGRAGSIRRLQEHGDRGRRKEPDGPCSAFHQCSADGLRSPVRGSARANVLRAADVRVQVSGRHPRCPAHRSLL